MDEKFFREMIQLAIQQSKLIEDEQEALEVKELYPRWENRIGKEVKIGEFYRYEDRLYKCIQSHTIQLDWKPSVTSSLWTVIDKEHKGTIEDPIPFVVNMEVFEGKYYIQNDILYKCTRDSGAPMYHDLSALVGTYMQVV